VPIVGTRNGTGTAFRPALAGAHSATISGFDLHACDSEVRFTSPRYLRQLESLRPKRANGRHQL
jgi:hypothetical protein